MAELSDEARAGLQVVLERARMQADTSGVLDALVRLAAVEIAVDRPGLALPLLKEARGLLEAGAGTPQLAAQVAYVRGQALARSGGDPLPSFREAADRFRQCDRPVDELRARLRVVQTLQDRRQVLDAIAELDGMLDDLARLRADRGLVDCFRHRAALRALLADFDRALADYDQAVAAAERLGDATLTLRVRLERRGVVPYSSGDAARWEDWATLLRDAKTLGDAGAAGEVQLQQAAAALRADQFDNGLAFAAAARQAALDANEPVLYLMACMLTAEGREGRGNHAGVLEILLTCKATLERAFGRDFAQPIIAVLDSLEPRWGKPLFQQALAEYRGHARARKAAEGQA